MGHFKTFLLLETSISMIIIDFRFLEPTYVPPIFYRVVIFKVPAVFLFLNLFSFLYFSNLVIVSFNKCCYVFGL